MTILDQGVYRAVRIPQVQIAAFLNTYGYTREEILGQHVSFLWSPNTSPGLHEQVLSQSRVGTWRGELLNRTKAAREFPIALSVSHIQDPSGKIVGLVGVAEDITERKRAEEALVTRTRQLEAVRALTTEITRELDLTTLLGLITRRATELVGSAAGTVFLWDEEAQILVPRAWHGFSEWRGELRLRLGEAIAGVVAERREGLIVNDYLHWPCAARLTLEQSGTTAGIGEPLIYRDRLLGVFTAHNTDAGRGFTESDRNILALFAGHAAIAIENARLFAELNQSYQSLQQAQGELVRAEKLRALGQMAAGIAHDLNNMLAAILGQVELLRLRMAAPEEALAGLDMLEKAATDGAHIVRRLQGFARQQPAGRLAPCDLAAVAQEAVEFTRPRWRDEPQRRGVAIEVRTALADLPPILGDAPEVREVLINLILNAVDAMPMGGTLTLTAHQMPGRPGDLATWQSVPVFAQLPDRPVAGSPGVGCVELAVTDTGIGMPDQVRERIFEPFFTTKGVQGTGLGLSVVYGIMERHGGYIAVASTPGQGTTFTLRFQVAPRETSVAPKANRPRRPARRLLLIDDDPAVRQTIAGLLRSAGDTVLEAEGGLAGLAHLAEGPVDLVLTDLGMPEMTGWDVARAVRSREPKLPVVLLTGWGDSLTVSGEERKLVAEILSKPLRLEEIQTIIGRLTG